MAKNPVLYSSQEYRIKRRFSALDPFAPAVAFRHNLKNIGGIDLVSTPYSISALDPYHPF